MFDKFWEWAAREVAEVKRAPVAILMVLSVGGALGWWLSGYFYAERFAVMEQRLNALKDAPDTQQSDVAPFLPMKSAMTTWGDGAPNQCAARLSGEGLTAFSSEYALALICGISTPEVDRFTDRRITITDKYTVRSSEFQVSAPATEAMTDAFDAAVRAAMPPKGINDLAGKQIVKVGLWYVVVLVPNRIDVKQIRQLADVVPLGGTLWAKPG